MKKKRSTFLNFLTRALHNGLTTPVAVDEWAYMAGYGLIPPVVYPRAIPAPQSRSEDITLTLTQ